MARLRTTSAVAGLTLVMLALGSLPVAAQPFAYVANRDGCMINEVLTHCVSAINTQTHAVTNIPLPSAFAVGSSFSLPVGIVATPDGRHVYVVHGNLLTVIDAATNAAVDTLPIADFGAQSTTVYLSPDGARLYVGVRFILAGSVTGQAVLRYEVAPLLARDPNLHALSFQLLDGKVAIDIAEAAPLVYVVTGGLGSTEAWVFDPRDPNKSAANVFTILRFPETTSCSVAAFSGTPLGVGLVDGRIFVPSFGFSNPAICGFASSSVTVFDAGSSTAIDQFLIPCCIKPFNANQSITPDRNSLYVAYTSADGSSDGFLVIDTSTTNFTEVPMSGVGRPAFTRDGTRGYAPLSSSNSVVAFDTATHTRSDPITVGNFPFAIVLAGASQTSTSLRSTLNPSVFGQALEFVATVTAVSDTPDAGGIPTGTVTFSADGVALGSAPLNPSGVASLTTTALNAGTRSITATYTGDATFAGSTSAALLQTVNKAPGTGTFTVKRLQVPYSDRATFIATVSPLDAAESVTIRLGTQEVTAPFANGSATLDPQVLGLAPGSRLVTASFNSPNYDLSTVTKSMSVVRENADPVDYFGSLTLCLCGNPSVPITVTVRETADGAPGDIGTATVTFVDRTKGTAFGTVPVTADPSDRTTGTATLHLPATVLGGASSKTFVFGFIVGKNYYRNDPADNETITVVAK